jgi:flagellar biosynthesis protein FlhA
MLQAWLTKIMAHRDALIIAGIVGIVLMMIVPVPKMLMDMLLALMISIALLTLLISMYLRSVLEFSVYPGFLLVVTLFRLALNIASTRLILSEADAGKVITAFGEYVTAGNMVVGVIMFIILVVIQFMVITKGSGRIAEVAARFTLDAMPQKQMAVDGDLNAGIITEEEAKQRRQDIAREADFYGAMDGASKFVRGDAIAGIIITGINILGGFILGMGMLGMDFNTALTTYVRLTIGDGLVSQIPALMISTSSGVIVSRAASSMNLGEEIVGQFTQNAKALLVAGIVMVLLATVPGIPFVPFFLLGSILLWISWLMLRKPSEEELAAEQGAMGADAEAEEAPKEEKIEDYLQVDQMELEIGYGIIPLVDVNQGGDLLERITMLRRQMASELGIVVPPIRIRDNIQLDSGNYIVKIKSVQVADGNLMMGSYLAMDPGNVSQKIVGIETVEPAFGLPALWITESQKEAAEIAGYTVVELPAVLATHLTELIKKHADEILTRQDVKSLLDNVKQHSPAIVEEVTPGLLSVGEIQQILSNLLRERISVRDLSSILEIMADTARINKDVVYVTEHCRLGLARSICAQLAKPGDIIPVMTLDPGLEQMLETSLEQTNRGPRLVLRPDLVGRLLDSLGNVYENVVLQNEQPVLVCSPNIRFPLKVMVESSYPNLTVLAYSEIVTGINITSLGVVSINEN